MSYGSGSLSGLISTDNMYIESDGTGKIPDMPFIAITEQVGFDRIGGLVGLWRSQNADTSRFGPGSRVGVITDQMFNKGVIS